MKRASDSKTTVVRRVRDRLRSVRGFAAADAKDWDEAFDLLDGNRNSPLTTMHLSRLYLRADRGEKAQKTAKRAMYAGRAPGIANYTHVLWELSRAGEDMDLGDLNKEKLRKDAEKTFGELRAISSDFDLAEKPFTRLASMVNELGQPKDWRLPAEAKDDIGERPALVDLGPFRWSPTTAPDWKLPTPSGTDVSLSEYRGKPVLVVFFLGFGCAHCVEQLQALGPRYGEFKQAGIDIVTVSTEIVPDNPYPFPIAGDEELNVFKQWRCFDDFEDMALHGTFLVDGAGKIRWMDISYEPFMDVDFLLEESQRLLALSDDWAKPAEASSGGKDSGQR